MHGLLSDDDMGTLIGKDDTGLRPRLTILLFSALAALAVMALFVLNSYLSLRCERQRWRRSVAAWESKYSARLGLSSRLERTEGVEPTPVHYH